MRERDTPRVQKLSCQAQFVFLFAVHRVTDDGMFEKGEVHANLMRASCFGFDAQERIFFRVRENMKNGNGIARVRQCCDSHFFAVSHVARKGRVNFALRCFDNAMHEREIGLVNFARGELALESMQRGVIFGDEHYATRIAVEPMHNTGALLIACHNVGRVSQHRVDECSRCVSDGGMHDHARGFVDDEDCIIVVQNVERNRFGLCRRRGGGGERQRYRVARFDRVIGFARHVVDANVSIGNERLQKGTRKVGTLRVEKFVEARALLSVCNAKCFHAALIQEIAWHEHANEIAQYDNDGEDGEKHQTETPRTIRARGRVSQSSARGARGIFAQGPEEHDNHRCRDGGIGNIKNGKISDRDKVHNVTEPQTVNEIAKRAADDETGADAQEPTRCLLGTIKPHDCRENEKGREGKNETELRKVPARRSGVVTADDAKPTERGKRRPCAAHTDLLHHQIFGELVKRKNNHGDGGDDNRAGFEQGFRDNLCFQNTLLRDL